MRVGVSELTGCETAESGWSGRLFCGLGGAGLRPLAKQGMEPHALPAHSVSHQVRPQQRSAVDSISVTAKPEIAEQYPQIPPQSTIEPKTNIN